MGAVTSSKLAMPEYFTDLFSQTLELALMVVLYTTVFFVLMLAIDEHKGKLSSIKHFSAVHPRRPYFYKDFKLELGYLFLNNIILAFIVVYAVSSVDHLMGLFMPSQPFAEAIESMPFIAQLALGAFIADAAFFFPHLFMHKFLWSFHSIHHSAKELHWLTAVRLHPVDHLAFPIGGAVILHIIGFSGEALAYAIALHTFYNLFVHANFQLGFPKPLCYILGSPNYHRWHHSCCTPDAYDKNIATMFPIFDLICRTYYYPHDRLPEEYGVSKAAGGKTYPTDMKGQLIYPFKRIYRKFKN